MVTVWSAPIRDAAQRPSTLLIVEDRGDTADAWSDLLRGVVPSVRVLMASTAEQALLRFRGEHVDLVLADYALPGKDGVWLLARIRQERPDTPLILTTSLQDPGVCARAVNEVHVDALFLRPFDIELVKTVLARLLRQHAAGRGRIPPFHA